MKCRSDSNTLTTNEFIDKAILIHKDRYDYSLVNYKSTKEKIIIICEEHSEFVQTPMKHLSGAGCPKCGNKFGIMENRWLDNYNINNENRQVRIGRYKVDGYDPITNTIYEFNGDFWHGNPDKYKKDDINPISGKSFGYLLSKTIEKENKLKKLGYNFISIWESEYNF